MRQLSGGEHSRTVPLSMMHVIACSSTPLVAKGQTGRGYLSLERDLRGGFEEGLGGYVAEVRSVLKVDRVDASDVVEEEDASKFGVSRMCPYVSWRVNKCDPLP